MRCRKAQKLLSAALDGEVDERCAATASTHSAGCRRCRRYADDLLAGAQALDLLTVPDPRPGFPFRLIARLPASRPETPPPRAWREALRPAPAAAAVLALACGVAMAFSLEVGPGPDVPEPPEPVETLYAESFDALPGESAAAKYLALLQDAGR
jgi:predicted anti-sigma-YlaC factor YlaD